MDRRGFLNASAALALGAAVPDQPTMTGDVPAYVLAAEHTHLIRALHHVGTMRMAATATRHASRTVALVSQANYADRPATLLAAVDAAQLASIIAGDFGALKRAQAWATMAGSLAKATGDPALRAEVRAEVYVAHGRAWADLARFGDRVASIQATAALDRAEVELDRAAPLPDRPVWARMDARSLRGWHSRVLTAMGRYLLAEPVLRAHLAAVPAEMGRVKSMGVMLAECVAARGEVDEAVSLALAGVEHAQRAGAGRDVARARRLHAVLAARAPSNAGVRQIGHALAA